MILRVMLDFSVADLYLLIFNAIVSGSGLAEGRDGFYFGSSDEHELLSISKTISKVLFDMGKSKSPEPTSFTQEEVQMYLVCRNKLYLLRFILTIIVGGLRPWI